MSRKYLTDQNSRRKALKNIPYLIISVVWKHLLLPMVRNSNAGWNSTTSKGFDVCPAVNSKFRPLPIPLAALLLSIMPPKEKSKASGSTEKKSAPKPAAAKPATEEVAAATRDGRLSKPDQTAYQAEQDTLKKEIDEVTAKLVCPQLFLCQRKPAHATRPPNGRMLSRRRLTAPREAQGTNEGMS